MKTAGICTKIRAASSRTTLAAFAVCVAFAARADNYWKGVDGADLATPANWSEEALPASAAGYFKKNGTLTEYSACLSKDETFFQFYWQLANLKTVFNLCGNTLTLSAGSSIAAMRLDTNYAGMEATFTNGTITTTGARCGVWVLGDNQTLTFGEGLVFNGDAAIHSGSAHAGSRIIVRDGAKVKGSIYFGGNQSEGTILVTGEGTEVDFGGGTLQMATSNASSTNNSFRVEDGAIVTNATVSIGDTSSYRASGATIALSGGGKLFTQNWNVSGGETTYIVQYQDYPAHRVEIGEGSGFHTRVLLVRGTNNVFAVDGGVLEAVKYDIAGTNTFHFAGTAPKMSQFAQNVLTIHADCTFSFEIPSSGYADVPCEFWPNGAFTMPETTRLGIDARAFARAGGGTVPLMKFKGGKDVTFSEPLLSRWNTELEAKHCSVSYDTSERTLVLTVTKPGLMIFVR